MMKQKTLQIIVQLIVAVLVFVLAYTATSKLLNMRGFMNDMYSQPFPRWLASILIVVVPLTEIVIMVLLVIPRGRRTGLKCAIVLMCAFSLYTLLVLLHVFQRVPCSCGGIIRELSWRQHAALNIFLTAISVIAYRLSNAFMHETGEPENLRQSRELKSK